MMGAGKPGRPVLKGIEFASLWLFYIFIRDLQSGVVDCLPQNQRQVIPDVCVLENA